MLDLIENLSSWLNKNQGLIGAIGTAVAIISLVIAVLGFKVAPSVLWVYLNKPLVHLVLTLLIWEFVIKPLSRVFTRTQGNRLRKELRDIKRENRNLKSEISRLSGLNKDLNSEVKTLKNIKVEVNNKQISSDSIGSINNELNKNKSLEEIIGEIKKLIDYAYILDSSDQLSIQNALIQSLSYTDTRIPIYMKEDPQEKRKKEILTQKEKESIRKYKSQYQTELVKRLDERDKLHIGLSFNVRNIKELEQLHRQLQKTLND